MSGARSLGAAVSGLAWRPRWYPHSAQPHRTLIQTEHGWYPLQEYLVRRRAADPPLAVRLEPLAASATPEALAGLQADLVVLGPSNPVLSLMPILTTPGVSSALARAPAVIGISPVVEALEPRTAPEAGRYRVRERVLAMLGLPHTADAVAGLWTGLLDAFVVDNRDADAARRIGALDDLPVLRADLLAADPRGRAGLAREVVEFGLGLPARSDQQEPDIGDWTGAPAAR